MPAIHCSCSFLELAANGPPLVLDGEIALPDERGVTDLDALTDARSGGRSERLALPAQR